MLNVLIIYLLAKSLDRAPIASAISDIKQVVTPKHLRVKHKVIRNDDDSLWALEQERASRDKIDG